MTQLYVRDGADYQEINDKAVIQQAQAILRRRLRIGLAVFDHHQKVIEFLSLKLGTLDHEIFAVLYLDSRHRLIEYVELFRGTVNEAPVYIREVARQALLRNASALILAHAHPSGDPTPSHRDMSITQKLKETLHVLDIRVLDHIVVAGDQSVSFAEQGLL